MKLKFTAEPKKVLVLLLFVGMIFVLISVIVSNVSYFMSNRTLVGFSLVPAITDHLLLTLTFLIIATVALLFGVENSFIEREDGIGFSLDEKKEKGYSTWSKEKEIIKDNGVVPVNPQANETEAAGIPIILKPEKVYVDDGEYHSLVIGSTGAGKTQTTVLPMVNLLAKNGESMIVTDPKGEIYEDTSELLRSLGYNILLLNFRDPQQGNMWNPLYLPYSLYKSGNVDKATELIDDLALNILYDESAKGQDPFWERTSADYFSGLTLALFEDAKEEEINLNSISLMTTVGEEKLANTTYVKEYFSFKDPAGAAYVSASSTLMAPNETKGSILSVFKQKVKLFAARENLSEMLSNNDFDMRDIGKKKTAVFIVIQDEKKTYHSLVTIFLKQCYETLITVAQESGGKLQYRTNFILDEFANMPPLKDVTTMITAARSRKMRFTFIIQNFAQLYEVYGKENGETIKGNCGNIVYLISTELSALEEISKMCGEVKSKEKEKTTSTPLVTVSDLQRMKQWDTLILRLRKMPFKTSLTPNFKMNWGHNFPKATFPMREKQPVHIFDLKAYVDKKREEKINNLLGSSGMPPSGGGGFTPPGGMGFPPSGPPPPVPFGSGTPENPFSVTPPKPQSPPGGINVEDLVKRIDAKIAELEEEERIEKEKQENKETPKETVQPPVENKVPEIQTEKVSDDQFFDDFFGDD